MKKLLSLAFIILSLATATAFAESVTAPVVSTDSTTTTQVKSAKNGKAHVAGKKHHKKHKHKKKGGK